MPMTPLEELRHSCSHVLATALLPVFPDAKLDIPRAAKPGKAVAVYAGECFWGVEGVFEHVRGVIDATSASLATQIVPARSRISGNGRQSVKGTGATNGAREMRSRGEAMSGTSGS